MKSILALSTALAVGGFVSAPASASIDDMTNVFSFERVGGGDSRVYRFLIDGQNIFGDIDFDGNEFQRFSISERSLRRLGVTGDLAAQINRDLQNAGYLRDGPFDPGEEVVNSFFDGPKAVFDLTEEFVAGTVDGVEEEGLDFLPVDRPIFDFRRIEDEKFDVFVNGFEDGRVIDFGPERRRNAAGEENPFRYVISRRSLNERFEVDNPEHILYREFADGWTEGVHPAFGEVFYVDVSEDRATGRGDTVFTFESASASDPNNFNVFLNGRSVNPDFFDAGGDFIDGSAGGSFTLTAAELAAQFGLIGLIDGIFDDDTQLGRFGGVVSVAEGAGDGVDKEFTFTVSSEFLATSLNKASVSDQTFFVKRKVASPS